MSSIPRITRTHTPVPAPQPVPAKILSLRSQAHPGRIIQVKRTDGSHAPLMREDLVFLAKVRFLEGRVQHFCSYSSAEPARYDAMLEPQRSSLD